MKPHQRRLKQQRRELRKNQNITLDAAKVCMDVLGVVPVYVLLEQYGWKTKRLSRFIQRYSKVMLAVNSSKISVNALADEILQETNIKYDDGDWFDMTEERRKAKKKKAVAV